MQDDKKLLERNEFLTDALRGVPPPEWTRRPSAKDDLRWRARQLRAAGMAYNDIVRELGVSKSSVSLWVRDLPGLSSDEARRRRNESGTANWPGERLRRAAERQATCDEAQRQVGELTDREVLIAGAVAYWCEGSKRKLRRPADEVVFTNSDPGLVTLFLRLLRVSGTPSADIVCRLQIHEGADVASAHDYWQDVTGLGPQRFSRPTFKRPIPGTLRRNTGVSYHGCLAVSVRRSRDLYWRIEGWAAACLADSAETLAARLTRGASSRRGPAKAPPAPREQAVALRMAGKSRREIRHILRIGSNETLNAALRDVPPPGWNRQPGYAESRQLAAAGVARYWQRERLEREDRRRSLAECAAGQIGELSDRDLMIAGAVSYWCEGTKSKPYRRDDRTVFINSDPGLIRLFQRFTAAAGVSRDQLVCRVHIHEGGDIEAAGQFWRDATGLPSEQFRRPTLKLHVPKPPGRCRSRATTAA